MNDYYTLVLLLLCSIVFLFVVLLCNTKVKIDYFDKDG